jgi:hypothetical protein
MAQSGAGLPSRGHLSRGKSKDQAAMIPMSIGRHPGRYLGWTGPLPSLTKESAMKAASIIGILLILAGGWVTLNGGSFTTREKVIDIGEIEVSADRERPIPMWAGIGAIIVGAVLVVSGMQKKSA